MRFADQQVGGDGDAGAFLAFGDDLEEQLGPTWTDLDVAKLLSQESVNAALAITSCHGIEGNVVSGLLECEGVFQVPLVDGWTVRGEPGRAYDISHEGLDVAVNISVLRQAEVGDDIDAALLNFAWAVGAEPDLLFVIRPPAKDHGRALVRFDVDGRTWLAAFMFTGLAAVLATSNSTADDDAAFKAGELVVASIGPLGKRRRFGRKT